MFVELEFIKVGYRRVQILVPVITVSFGLIGGIVAF